MPAALLLAHFEARNRITRLLRITCLNRRAVRLLDHDLVNRLENVRAALCDDDYLTNVVHCEAWRIRSFKRNGRKREPNGCGDKQAEVASPRGRWLHRLVRA